ncbi:MAG: DHHA1 domain-containing protein [Bacilli bacterium]|nr:DHHA1 domain-containing protein [Bacilli bacterium]
MKTLLISHSDLDGISCNLLLDLLNFDYDSYNIEVVEVYSTLEQVLNDENIEYDQIFITDLTVSRECYEMLDKSHIKYHVLDHHQTHLYAKDFKNATVKVTENNRPTCGTELFFNYLKIIYPQIDTPLISSYVELVRQIDTYTMESEAPRNLSTLLFIYGKTSFLKKMKTRLKKERDIFTFTDFEKRYLKIKNEEFDAQCLKKEKELMYYQINGLKCGVLFCGNIDKSELGHRVSRNHPDLDLVILIDAAKSISYRTERDDVDVAKFAENFGGGGHAKASGSSITDEFREEIIKSYFKDVKRLEIETN